LADGQRASTHEQQANRWLQHFESVLNCPEPIITYNFENDDSDDPCVEVCMEQITEEEVARAVKREQ